MEIKRSRCQQSLICQRQSQQQSEKWGRYQRDPRRSDQPPAPHPHPHIPPLAVFLERPSTDTISLRPATAHLIPACFPRRENSPGIWRTGREEWRLAPWWGWGWGEEDVWMSRSDRTQTGRKKVACSVFSHEQQRQQQHQRSSIILRQINTLPHTPAIIL